MAPPTTPPPPTAVYDAVVAEKSVDELRAVIEACSGLSGRVTRRQAQQEERLAAAKAAVNAPGGGGRRGARKGELPLAAARRLGRSDLMIELVVHGADVKAVFGPGATPIAVTIACGDAADAVRALLRRGGGEGNARELIRYDPDTRLFARSPAFTCTAAHLCIVPLILTDVDVDAEQPAPRLRCLEVLVREGGADVNVSNNLTPLGWLVDAASDHARALRTLQRLGADPNGGGGSAAAISGRGGRGQGQGQGQGQGRAPLAVPPALAWLRRLDSGDSNFPIVPCLRTLVSAGARVSGRISDLTDDTLLLLAARRCHVPALRFLLEETEAAGDVGVANRNTGELPLTACGMIGPVVGPLLRAGADPNQRDLAGRLPLLQALRKDAQPETHFSAALLMLKAGAAVAGVKGPVGETPLMLACARWPSHVISDNRVALLEELLKRTPVEERRLTRASDGSSAVDLMAGDGLNGEGAFAIEQPAGWDDDAESDEEAEEARQQAYLDAAIKRTFESNRSIVAQLRIDGAPVLPENEAMVKAVVASHALPMLARRMGALEAEMARRRSESRRWRAHYDLVGLAFDYRDAREAEERVAAKEARVRELEEELREGGYGTHSEGGEEGEGEGGEEGGAAAATAAAKPGDE